MYRGKSSEVPVVTVSHLNHQFTAKIVWFNLYQGVLVQLPNSGEGNIGNTSKESQLNLARIHHISKFHEWHHHIFMITVMFMSGLISM